MRNASALIIFLLCTAPALAQPAEVSRVLRNFDFEERRLGNVEDLPMHWNKVEGTGLPHYVNGRLSSDRAHGGEYSFRFDLDGGSLIYRYDAGQIHVQPGAHYRVEGYVQTTALPNARARITAYFVDQDNRPMLATVRHSELFASKPDDAHWEKIGVELSSSTEVPVDPAQPIPVPKSLVIELALLQPQQYAPPSLGQRTLFKQDIRGSAWFDDVTVAQVPKVAMSTDRPGNIFRRSDPLILKVLVNDRFTDDLAAQLVISDTLGKTVYQRSGALDMTAAQVLGPNQKRMTLALPAELQPGWYEAALVMTSKGQFVGRQTLDLVLLADDSKDLHPDPRFGIVATDLPFEGWDDLPQILSMMSAGRVKLPVWSDAGDVQQMNSAAFDRLLERLSDQQIEPTACLVGVPDSIAAKLQPTRNDLESAASSALAPANLLSTAEARWIQLLKADPQIWQPQLAYMLARHATHLEHWQLGADGSDAFVTQPQMRQVYAKIYQQFANLIEKPDLAMPWPAWYELDGQLPATIALHIKPEVLPSQVPLYVHDMQIARSSATAAQSGAEDASGASLAANRSSPLLPQRTTVDASKHNLSIYLEPLDRQQYGRDVQIRDLAQRIVYALSADAKRIDLKLPFNVAASEMDDASHDAPDAVNSFVKQPQELLIIIRTIMTTLSGAAFRGKVPIAEGVEAFLFDRGGEGILVLWDRGVAGGVKQLAVNLGEHPQRIDLWGNISPLIQQARARSASGDLGSSDVKLDVGPMPIFLVGIDAQLAQLRASVALDNPLLESSFKPHTRKIRFMNPYRQAIAGSFKLTAPSGWVINPPTQSFSLNPGEVFDREITLEFPYNSFAGTKTINAEFQVQADTNSSFSVPIQLKLGLSDVGLQTLALRDGNDVIVQQMITNYGEKPIDYTAFAIYPGQARQDRLVTNLAAGRTTIKKYRFKDVKITPQSRVRSGLKELDGTRLLNDEAQIQ